MRNILVTIFLLGMIFFAIAAKAEKPNYYNGYGICATYEVVDAQTSMLVKNNFKHGFLGEPSAVLVFTTEDYKVEFNAFTKVEIDGKIFVIGNGNHNVNIICVNGDNVCVPVGNHKKMLITNKALSKFIKNVVEDVPEDYGNFNRI